MSVKQVVVVPRSEPRSGQGFERTAFFDENGAPIEFGGELGPVSASDVTVAASEGIVGADVQAVLADLAARVAALEP